MSKKEYKPKHNIQQEKPQQMTLDQELMRIKQEMSQLARHPMYEGALTKLGNYINSYVSLVTAVATELYIKDPKKDPKDLIATGEKLANELVTYKTSKGEELQKTAPLTPMEKADIQGFFNMEKIYNNKIIELTQAILGQRQEGQKETTNEEKKEG